MNSANLVIVIFWFIIAVTQAVLMIIHFAWTKQNISILPLRPTIAEISGVPLNIRESIEDVNVFINRLNRDYHQSNMAQFWGYTAGFVASLIALILSFRLL